MYKCYLLYFAFTTKFNYRTENFHFRLLKIVFSIEHLQWISCRITQNSFFFFWDDSKIRKQLCLGILWPSCSHEFKLISFSITKVWLSIGFDGYCLAKTPWDKMILDAYIYSLKPCLISVLSDSCVSNEDCSLFLGSNAECWLNYV